MISTTEAAMATTKEIRMRAPNGERVTACMREACVALAAGGDVERVYIETRIKLAGAELIGADGALTVAGETVASAERRVRAMRKGAARASARARTAAMRGMGLRRTAYGWE